jgi:hypothetical protein
MATDPVMEASPASAGQLGARSNRAVRRLLAAGLLLLIGGTAPAHRSAGADSGAAAPGAGAGPAAGLSGPTLRLDYGRGASPGNPVAEFM